MTSATIPRKEELATDQRIKAKIVGVDQLDECGQRLREGYLVAFPTETVYGLGCHALDSAAVAKVFEAKERPLTDPLIVHVSEAKDAFALWRAPADSTEGKVLAALCDRFWPGPLTLVSEANLSVVPATIMAGTGFCAARSPSHATARALLATAQVPLAAPSANKFGHVSPTTAQHVFDDLSQEDVWIVNDGEICDVGVESTVVKVECNDSAAILTVLRQGAVAKEDLEDCLTKAGLQATVTSKNAATQDHVASVAPGQSIRHYSPHVPSYLCAESCLASSDAHRLASAVVIDYGGKLLAWKEQCLQYRDLSSSADSAAAAQGLFDTLRWAEQVAGAERILFPLLEHSTDALALALKDRLTRAASGVVVASLADTM